MLRQDKEVFVCFHESIPQTVVELAFRDGFGTWEQIRNTSVPYHFMQGSYIQEVQSTVFRILAALNKEKLCHSE